MYHVSDVKTYLRCPKLFQRTYGQKKLDYNPFLRNDEELTMLAIEKLKIDNYYLGERSEDATNTLAILGDYQWIVKGRFEYLNLRVKIPFLKKIEDGYCLYFLQLHNYPKPDDLLYYALNYLVLKRLGIIVTQMKLIHLNAYYIRQENLDPHRLFIVSDTFYNESNRPSKKVFDTVKSHHVSLEKTLEKMDEALLSQVLIEKKSNRCYKRSKCDLYYECFEEEEDIENDSILTLVSSRYKNEMARNGVKYLKDANLEFIEGSKAQFAQIMASRQGGLYYDRLGLKMWLNKMENKPLIFIDFEWDTFAIPPFHQMKPFDVVCFQYSVHVLEKNGELTHKEYIGYKDCRQEFIENLLNDLPAEGTIVAFNADGAEKLRLRELGVQYPQYYEALANLQNRMIDLSRPFSIGLIYDTKMKGNYSLKIIANMIDSSIDYQQMDIHHGMEAVYRWRKMDRSHIENKEDIEMLLSYCRMDTYSMVVIYRWLRGLYETV